MGGGGAEGRICKGCPWRGILNGKRMGGHGGDMNDSRAAQAAGHTANVGRIADHEHGLGCGARAEMFGQTQGLFAGVGAAGENRRSFRGDAAQVQLVQIGPRSVRLFGPERHGDEDAGAGMSFGGAGGIIRAHQAGIAGDAAAAHQKDERGFARGGMGEIGETFIREPG